MAKVTVHTFTKLGFRTLPIGQTGVTLVRDPEGKKQLLTYDKRILSFRDAMPANWTTVYGHARVEHLDTPLGGVICGVLTEKQENELEIIALDCDNEQAWQLFTLLHPDYQFKYRSVGKEGGTILYYLPAELRQVHQYSIKTDTIHFEYMAKRESGANAMVYLPTTANKTKELIEPGAELDYPPSQIINLIKVLKPKPSVIPSSVSESLSPTLPFNAPLVKQFVLDSEASTTEAPFGKLEVTPLVERVYQIFTPKKFRAAPHYVTHKWIHPNSNELLELGSWSEYIVGVSAIAGSDPSIDVELYTNFMQVINAQVDDPMPTKRFLEEVISPMVLQKASIRGKPIWRYNEKWDQTSHTIVNQYGETLEFYTLENAANKFLEYNHTTREIIEIPGVRGLRDQIYSKDTSPQQEAPSQTIVKKLKLIRTEDSIKLPLGIFTDSQGHTILNTAEPTFPLRVLKTPALVSDPVDETNLYVQAFNIFVAHLVNQDPVAELFMKQVIAYHGRHLESIPVILYMVGVGGAGKSHFASFMELLFGSNATSRPTADQITSRFNDFLLNTALLILSETGDSPKKAQEGIKGILKTVTGEKTIDIETKRISIRKNVPVFALPVLLANEPWYHEDDADRRLFSIMPKSTMAESELISEFERTHGLRIVAFIEEGIKSGVIPKYIASFCPAILPDVPLTEDKINLSLEQQDPIMIVKNVVATGNWFKLFDLMEEYDAKLFFTAMESPKLRDKNCLFKNQLTELVEKIRGDNEFLLSNAAISKEFSVRWLPRYAMQYRPRKDNALAVQLGYIKWLLPIAEPYEQWKLVKLEDDDI